MKGRDQEGCKPQRDEAVETTDAGSPAKGIQPLGRVCVTSTN